MFNNKHVGLVLFFCVMMSALFSMPKDIGDKKVISGAVFFKIHMSKMCWVHMSDQYFYDLVDCKNYSDISHEKGSIVISFHDKTGALISFVDVAHLMQDDDFNIVIDYAKSRLDATVKHAVIKAFIGYNSETREREIAFYNEVGDIVYHKPYTGTAYIGDIVAAFYEELDLGGLEEVADMSFYL